MPIRTKKRRLRSKKRTRNQKRVLILDPDKMTPKQNAFFEGSLNVLSMMRKGQSLTQASKQVGVSPHTVKRYIGSALKLQNHKWKAKQSDRLLRKIRIYENGKQTWIIVRGIKQASIVGEYHSAIGRLANDQSILLSFKKIRIKDVNGKFHRLETDSAKVFSILEQQEDVEFYTIYGRN